MTLLLQDRDERGVVTRTLNRPQAFNALSEAMLTATHRDDAVESTASSAHLDGGAGLTSSPAQVGIRLALTSRRILPRT